MECHLIQEAGEHTRLEWDALFDRTQWPGSAIDFRAGQLVGKRGFVTSDVDDLKQDLALHIFLRWPAFDPSRSSARTYVDRLLTTKQAELLRRKGKRSLGRHQSSSAGLPEPRTDDRPTKLTDLRLDVSSAQAKLPSDLKRISRLLAIHSPSEVARQLGIHRGRVYEIIGRIRKRFEDGGLREYVESAGRFGATRHMYEKRIA